jgi:hypothetical protein
MRRVVWSGLGIWIFLLALPGCGDGSSQLPEPLPVSGPLKSPADPLTTAELDRFLQIVEGHPQQRAPEFTPPEDDAGIREGESVTTLVEESRSRYRKFFDPQRQGEVWARDPQWSRLLHRQGIAPAEFAALVARVSCAIARVRLEGRTDLTQLSRLAQEEIDQLSIELNHVPRPFPLSENQNLPSTPDPRAQVAVRTQALVQLSRDVALLEFAETLLRVPAESCTLVKRYAPQLRPLLPQGKGDPFAELVEWQRQRSGAVIHASHDRPR